jgi:hypothetical protein
MRDWRLDATLSYACGYGKVKVIGFAEYLRSQGLRNHSGRQSYLTSLRDDISTAQYLPTALRGSSRRNECYTWHSAFSLIPVDVAIPSLSAKD